jgi:hypothetical protein
MDEHAIAQTRRSGIIIAIISTLLGVVYAIGVLRRSYWALAAPVTLATAGALYIALWIARALIATPAGPVDS